MNRSVTVASTLLLIVVIIVFAAGVVVGGQVDDIETSRHLGKKKSKNGKAKREGAKKGSVLSKPNVLIILWDTVRADRLSLYGNERKTSPFIERLAETSAVFDRAISPAMWTVPSHGSLFTGLAVSEHGATVKHRQLDRRFETMAERFGSSGYQTYAFSANPNLNPRSIGLLQGFNTIEFSWSKELGPLSLEVTKRKLIETDRSTEISLARKNSAGQEEVFFNAAPVARKVFKRWLKDRDDTQPFFAYINMMEAHKPRVPTQRSRDAVIGDSELVELGLQTSITERDQLRYMVGLQAYTKEELSAIEGVYDASIRELDAATHGVLEDLRVRDLLDNTIIVLVSDHGEALGEHGLFAHKYGLYDELVRVPLLIRYPEKVEPKRYSHAVSTRDLYGTLMDLADLRRPKSLKESPSLLSKEGPTAVYSEIASTNSFKYEELLERFPQVESNVQPFLQTARMVESNGFKLIAYEDGRRELYNIKRDPGEMADLSSTDKAQVDHLKGVLLNWFQGLEPWERRGSGLPEEVVDPTGDEAKLLQLLGYVE